jgi:hypothetical protein
MQVISEHLRTNRSMERIVDVDSIATNHTCIEQRGGHRNTENIQRVAKQHPTLPLTISGSVVRKQQTSIVDKLVRAREPLENRQQKRWLRATRSQARNLRLHVSMLL